MLGLFGKEAPQVQAYGKLPLAKDYLRVGAGEGTGREFREWLDQAFSGQTSAGAPTTLPWPMRFVVSGGRGEPLLGTAWPSSDAGGLRKFPFALFVERRKKALIEALSRGLADQHRWWEAIETFYDARENFADGQSFLAAMRGKTIEAAKADPDDGGDEEAEHVAWQEWLQALWPADPAARLAETLRAVAQAARDRRPLRLPLVGELPIAEQVAAWCRALTELQWVERGELPSLFFPRASGAEPQAAALPASLVAFHGPLAVRDVAWLSQPAGSSLLDDGGRAGTGGNVGSNLDDGTRGAVGPGALKRGAALADSMLGALVSFKARS